MTRTFDPIELELLWRRLISAVDEAAVAMVRTSFSTLVRESYDFSCVITDQDGQSLVQASESIPSFIGTLPETVKHFLRFFPPDKLEPGVTYRDIGMTLRISSRFENIDQIVREALGEPPVPSTTSQAPQSTTPAADQAAMPAAPPKQAVTSAPSTARKPRKHLN